MYGLYDRLYMISEHNRGFSYRKIAKETDITLGTVGYHLKRYEELYALLLACNPNDHTSVHAITQRMFKTSDVKARGKKPYKLKGELKEYLDEIVAFEMKKRKDLGSKHKQSLKFNQVTKMAHANGFQISNTTVTNYLNERLRKPKEAFVPQQYEPGQRFEFDYGEVKLKIADKVSVYQMAVMTAPASGVIYCKLYKNSKIDTFIDAQVCFFEYMGGTFREGVYDNMRNAVMSFSKNKHKRFNTELLKLATYYHFGINVTNIASGNEKGSVEKSVKNIRTIAFAPVYEFDSLESARLYLDKVISKLNKPEMLEYERKGLGPLPPRYDQQKIIPQRKVDKSACVRVAGSTYSVPDTLVGKRVDIEAYDNEVVILYKEEVVASHKVDSDQKRDTFEIRHYLKTLERKPGALRNSKALRAHPLLKGVFHEYYEGRSKEFIDCLIKYADKSDEEIAVLLIQENSIKQPFQRSKSIHSSKVIESRLRRVCQ